MAVALIITEGMLVYRQNILKMEEIEIYIFDLSTAIKELEFAFNGGNDIKFDVKYMNNMMIYADKNSLGLGEAFTRITEEFGFPFRKESLLSKKCLVNSLNGGMEMLEKEPNYDKNRLLTALFKDQMEAHEFKGEIYDIEMS